MVHTKKHFERAFQIDSVEKLSTQELDNLADFFFSDFRPISHGCWVQLFQPLLLMEWSFQQLAGVTPASYGAPITQRLLTYAIKDTVSVLYWYEKLSRNGKFFEKIFESFFLSLLIFGSRTFPLNKRRFLEPLPLRRRFSVQKDSAKFC